jgi:hypothetical protein
VPCVPLPRPSAHVLPSKTDEQQLPLQVNNIRGSIRVRPHTSNGESTTHSPLPASVLHPLSSWAVCDAPGDHRWASWQRAPPPSPRHTGWWPGVGARVCSGRHSGERLLHNAVMWWVSGWVDGGERGRMRGECKDHKTGALPSWQLGRLRLDCRILAKGKCMLCQKLDRTSCVVDVNLTA